MKLLHFAVFMCGAAVMVIEIVGTRALAPVFGAGLMVWAALLSSTLCSLAIGYYWGGGFADRYPVARSLGQVMVGSGAALGLAVVIAPPMLAWGLSLGPRLGSLLCALLLFSPPLTGLGMVGPVAVRLIATDVKRTGHGVGQTYAISTAGGLIGTLTVVFAVIPSVETRTILLGTAVGLCLIGLPWLLGAWVRAGVLVGLLVWTTLAGLQQRKLPEHLEVVERAHSPYGLLEVIDNTASGIRMMRADHSIIGGRFSDGTGLFSYLHVIEALRYVRPEATRMLQIGLGTGALSTVMKQRRIASDVVELDPDVVRLAKKHFDYVPSGQVFIEDARTFLNRAQRQYDLVVHDTFTGGTNPSYLLSLEVFRQIKRLLQPGGVLVVNFVGFTSGEHARASYAAATTMREVFKDVRVFRDASPEGRSSPLANMLFFASDESLDFSVLVNLAFENRVCAETLGRFTEWEVLTERVPSELITDARNPLSTLQAPIAEAHYTAMGKLLPQQAWLPW